MKNITKTNRFFTSIIITLLAIFGACESNDPTKEDTPELITKITLSFVPEGGGTTITATASDPDGEGVKDIEVDGPINLEANKTYILKLTLINELAEQTAPEYNITDEVEEESDEHLFFFGWTGLTFSDPAGDGNVDNRQDAVNYEDEDNDGLPLGLQTKWKTGIEPGSGTFRIILKHQPDLKSASSDVNTGETDLDVEFVINVN
jgi:hypothetical protein